MTDEHVITKQTPATLTRRIEASPFGPDDHPVVGPEQVQRDDEDTLFVCSCSRRFLEPEEARRHLSTEAENKRRRRAEA